MTAAMSAACIEQVMHLVLGTRPPVGAAVALEGQTHGDPRLVLVHLLVALGGGRPSVETFLGLLDGGDPSAARPPCLQPEGDYWAVSYAGRVVRLRDARGLHYLAPLIRAPGSAIHVRDLVATGAGRRNGDTERARQAVTKGIKLVLDRLQSCHPALAEHLSGTVERGYFCRYLPEPGQTVKPSPEDKSA